MAPKLNVFLPSERFYAGRARKNPDHVCIGLEGSNRQQPSSAWRTTLMLYSCFLHWQCGRDVSNGHCGSTDRHLYVFGVRQFDASNSLAAIQEQQLTRVRSRQQSRASVKEMLGLGTV